MNAPAIALYKSKGVDLYHEYLEIALCAQHNNGGIGVDLWWQTSISGLFAAGECAGTHGVARPGGSALNAGQVGSLRAAQYVASHPGALIDEETFYKIVSRVELKPERDALAHIQKAQRRMSDHAAAVRDPEKIKEILAVTLAELEETTDPDVRDVLLTQGAVLTAMAQPNIDPGKVQEVRLTEKGFEVTVRPVRPIPKEDGFFENVWRNYRESKNVY